MYLFIPQILTFFGIPGTLLEIKLGCVISQSMEREKNVQPGLNYQVCEAKKLMVKHKLHKA